MAHKRYQHRTPSKVFYYIIFYWCLFWTLILIAALVSNPDLWPVWLFWASWWIGLPLLFALGYRKIFVVWTRGGRDALYRMRLSTNG